MPTFSDVNRRGFLKLLGLAAPAGLIAARLMPAETPKPKIIGGYWEMKDDLGRVKARCYPKEIDPGMLLTIGSDGKICLASGDDRVIGMAISETEMIFDFSGQLSSFTSARLLV